ncbi:MAG: restriction endonuclease subunit S [Cyanobacteria bacterium]|nr:restriction endonuclease subunit S [Cyanobacteriota bacterium]
MSEWAVVPLRELIDPERSICYGIVQPGSAVSDGIPIIRVNNFRDGRIDLQDHLKVSKEVEEKYSRSRLQGGELIVTLVGSIGLSAVVPDELKGWNIARAVGLVPLRSDVDKRWVNFVLRTQASQEFIWNHANTTVQATFNLRDLANLPIPLPPEYIRQSISNLLSSLDDKIELNRRMNETLEAMARAIFKDWFVDFGPTRAKMLGRAAYLPEHIWSLFPDAIDPETGLPQGWGEREIGDFIELLDHKRIPLSKRDREKRPGEYPYYGATSIMDYIDDYLFDKILLLLGEDGSVKKEDGSPFTQYVWGKIWVNNHAHVITGRNISVEQLKIFFDLCDVSPFVTGAVQPKLNQSNLKRIKFTFGGENIHKSLDQVIAPLFENIRLQVDESRTLADLRDRLLPKLMSGEIRVNTADKMIEEVL